MQIFLDTGNIDEIKAAAETGLLNGVTTNPSLLSAEGKTSIEVASAILEIVTGEVSLEVIATDYEKMIEEAHELAALSDRVVVKLPTTLDGLRACRRLSDEGVHVNMTLIFSSIQALLAAKAGAYYASIFVGRLDDIGDEGEDVVIETRNIFDYYDYATQILFASVRTVEHVKNAALLGADIVTVPYKIFQQLPNHPLTDKGLAKFLADYSKLQK